MTMKRFQMMLDEELDQALERQAAAEGTSKAALIRDAVRESVRPLPPRSGDPLFQMIGVDDCDPVADIDEFLYG